MTDIAKIELLIEIVGKLIAYVRERQASRPSPETATVVLLDEAEQLFARVRANIPPRE